MFFQKDIPIETIIKNYLKDDKPFYIVNIQDIIYSYENWLKLLPDIKPYYAIKSNPNPIIINILNSLGANFDCASYNEIEKVINITKDPNKIIFANPCKMISHIKYAKENNIPIMTFDCIEELYKIREHYKDSKLILRLCVDDSYSICKFNSKFGCKLENIQLLIDFIKISNLNLVGFSFHVGSGCLNSDSYYNAIELCKKAYDIALYNNIKINIIDIGGGFPSPNEFMNEIAYKINKARYDFFSDLNVSFIAEPGRYFVEKSHTLVLNIICKKKENDTILYYLNDGIYGSFNCILFDYKEPTILPLEKKNTDILYKSKFFGPTCDSIDIIKKEIMFPELKVGDWVYILNFGAYTTSSSSSFNGFSVKDYKWIKQ